MSLLTPPRATGQIANRYPYPGWGPTTVTVPLSDFTEGRFPSVCVVTGGPATANVRRQLNTTPRWVAAFIFANFVAFLAAVLLTQRRASGLLPVSSSVAARLHRRRRVARSLGLAAILLVGAAQVIADLLQPVFPPGPLVAFVLTGVGIVAFIGWLGGLFAWGSLLGVQGRVIDDAFGDRWVQLRGVHPAFAIALASEIQRTRGG